MNRVAESRSTLDYRCSSCNLLLQRKLDPVTDKNLIEQSEGESTGQRRIRSWIDIHRMTNPEELVLEGEDAALWDGELVPMVWDEKAQDWQIEGLPGDWEKHVSSIPAGAKDTRAGVVSLPAGWWKNKRLQLLRLQNQGDERNTMPKWLFVTFVSIAASAALGLGTWVVYTAATSQGRWRSGSAEEANVVHMEEQVFELKKMAQQFVDAKSVGEVLTFVRDPERVETSVEKFMAQKGFANAELSPYPSKSESDFILAQYLLKYENGRMRMITFVRDPVGPKIDWDAFTREGSADYEELVAGVPEGAEVRVVVSYSQYYNYDFKDENEWTAYDVIHADWDKPFTGYLKKNSEEDVKIARTIREMGGAAAVILKISTTPLQGPRNQCVIEKLVENGWLKGVSKSNNPQY